MSCSPCPALARTGSCAWVRLLVAFRRQHPERRDLVDQLIRIVVAGH